MPQAILVSVNPMIYSFFGASLTESNIPAHPVFGGEKTLLMQHRLLVAIIKKGASFLALDFPERATSPPGNRYKNGASFLPLDFPEKAAAKRWIPLAPIRASKAPCSRSWKVPAKEARNPVVILGVACRPFPSKVWFFIFRLPFARQCYVLLSSGDFSPKQTGEQLQPEWCQLLCVVFFRGKHK